MEEKEELKSFGTQVSPTLIHDIKQACLDKNMTIREFVRKACSDLLVKYKKKK